MTEIVFIVEESQDGGYFAKAIGEGIITQADTLPELREMIKDAIKCHFDNPEDFPKIAHLHVTRDEVLELWESPGTLDASDLIKALKRHGYIPTRQTGSHIRLTTMQNGQHHITIPNHSPLKVGTLNAILTEIAGHLGLPKETILWMDIFNIPRAEALPSVKELKKILPSHKTLKFNYNEMPEGYISTLTYSF